MTVLDMMKATEWDRAKRGGEIMEEQKQKMEAQSARQRVG